MKERQNRQTEIILTVTVQSAGDKADVVGEFMQSGGEKVGVTDDIEVSDLHAPAGIGDDQLDVVAAVNDREIGDVVGAGVELQRLHLAVIDVDIHARR